MATLTEATRRGPTAVPGRTTASALIARWRELGGLGRLAIVGLMISGFVAVGLGLWIEGAVRHHLLGVRAEVIQEIADDLAADGLLPLGTTSAVAAEIDAVIEHRVIGGEITKVVVRDSTGRVVYGAAEPEASTGDPEALSVPHVEQHQDGLLHYHVPVTSPEGYGLGTFEVFQQSRSYTEILSRVRRNLWAAIALGLGSLGVAMAAATLGHARVLDQRRRHAERLLGELVHVEDQERRRIVGALHDDVGQPLYRVLYGLEGCRAGLEDDPERASELERLGALIRDVDRTLRHELHHLHRSTLDSLDLSTALEAIAQDCRDESDLTVEVTVDTVQEPTPVARSVLVRAVEEALTNVRRHASAAGVRIRVTDDGEHTSVEVVDDGTGVNAPAGLGLTIAAERLGAIGGGLALRSGKARGTVFRAWVPHRREVPL
jgi:signal transduction histidine kinase